MEFNAEKIMSGTLNHTKIRIDEPIKNVVMNNNEIFLQTTCQKVYHMRRNEWYETKTYSDPVLVNGLGKVPIKSIVSGVLYNYFLTTTG